MSRNKRQASQRIESELARVNSAQAAYLSVTETSPNVMGELLQAFSSFERNDFKISEAMDNEPESSDLDDSLPVGGG